MLQYRLSSWLLFLLYSISILPQDCLAVTRPEETYIRSQTLVDISFDELQSLSKNPYPGLSLKRKLEQFWITPEINNEAFYAGKKPITPSFKKLGKSLVLAQWNIEKSIFMDRIIQMLTSEPYFYGQLDREKALPHSKTMAKIERQRRKFLNADIIVLTEMEIGIKRSNYLHAARELAKALGMNYVYAPQYLEIDPVVLGTEKLRMEDGSEDAEANEYYGVDPSRFKGVFGSAVLSRYPIKSAEVAPLHNQGYDWYSGEKQKPGFLEYARRFGTKTAFKNIITRELKVGGRIYFRTDLEVPGLPENTLTIINVHLEIKCLPEARERQTQEILSYVHGIKHPVILAGDFNSAPNDLSQVTVARTVKRAVKDPTNWLQLAINYLSPYALVLNTTRGISNVTKNLQNPTAGSIPIIAPNKVRPLFDMIREFKFQDGGVFDFRGDPDKSMNRKRKLLANSNERDLKGFKTTFQVRRPIGPVIGKLRLDWIFVKSFLRLNPVDKKGSYRFAPHFAETLEELNTAFKEHLSDHHPSVVILPFEEPGSMWNAE